MAPANHFMFNLWRLHQEMGNSFPSTDGRKGENGATGIRTANNSFCGGDITGLISAEIWLFLTVWVHVTPQICRLLRPWHQVRRAIRADWERLPSECQKKKKKTFPFHPVFCFFFCRLKFKWPEGSVQINNLYISGKNISRDI